MRLERRYILQDGPVRIEEAEAIFRSDEQRAVSPLRQCGDHFRHRPDVMAAGLRHEAVKTGRHRHVKPVERVFLAAPEGPLADLVAAIDDTIDLVLDNPVFMRHFALSPYVLERRTLSQNRSNALPR